MAARPTWQGHLRLSLVTCPVALYAATSKAGDVSFHLLNPKTNNRIKMVTTDPDTGPVNRGDLVKGYEVSKNSYIVMTDEELKSVKLESTKTIDIERFVAADEIDRLYWNDPYYLTPDGGVAGEAYGVIRDALRATDRIALGRVVLHTRERLMALEPRDDGIVAWSLRTADEVRAAAPYFEGFSKTKTDKNMLAIAEKIIEQGEGDFDPSTFTDRYEEALKALIASKKKGQKPVTAEPPKDTEVSDLMEALRKSLQRGAAATPSRKPAGRAGTASGAPKTARRKTPATGRKAG